MRRFLVWTTLGVLATSLAAPGALNAQGYSVNEHSSCATGRAGTGVASPCSDGSAIVYNPAGLASLAKGAGTFAIGGTFIAPSGNFTDDATGIVSKMNSKVYPVPAVYLTRGLTNTVAAGIGLFAPYGLTTDWPTTSQGRFLGYHTVIHTIYVQPTVAAKLGQRMKVGGGLDVNFAHVQLRQRVDLSTQLVGAPAPPGVTFGNLGIPNGTDFADVNLHANATGIGYHLGLMVEATDRISFGVRYLSRQKVTFKSGNVDISEVSTGILLPASNPFGVPGGTPLDALLASQFAAGGPLTNQTATTALRFPEQWVVGTTLKPTDQLQLFFDVQYTHWEVFKSLDIAFQRLPVVILPENFRNVTAYRFGGQYDVTPATSLRLGYISHDAAEPDGSVVPNLPEGRRSEFTLGVGTRLTNRIHGDVAYQYIDQGDRRGRTVPAGQPDNGLYHFNAHIFGATLAFDF
ncbi:MAG: outer membrane protein transport protein [Gemmatimonadota bacterium]